MIRHYSSLTMRAPARTIVQTDRQTDRQQHKSVLFSCVQSKFHNAVSRGALRPRSFRGRGASFLRFGSSGVLGEGVSEACIAMKPAWRW